ncbi:MAG: formylglycine-generating enzyme family protein [Kiritimatiellia bacterium]|jgi:formylglycine-generating enzyme required for sulfatase activity|nr:formylglycine-generating enzyme family protein [Kiritimatiellia bacterium]
MKTMTVLLGMLTLGLMPGIVAAEGSSITDVAIRQRWPWSRLVDIEYVLDNGDPDKAVNVLLRAYDGTPAHPLNIPADSLSGDLYGVKQGFRRIVWDPAKTAYTNEPLVSFRVELTPTPQPLYMIVDLTKEAGTSNQVEYVYEETLAGGAYGTVQTNPVPGVTSVIWTGVTNDPVYATDKLVLRHVPAGTFTMGSPGDEVGRSSSSEDLHTVTLTKDYYIGVFEVTQQQWNHITNHWPSAFKNTDYRAARPVENIKFVEIRGSSIGTNWPSSHAVDPDSFLGKLRTKTGFSGFDLPTEAQWEYACRAGTGTALYTGENLTNTAADARLDPVGRYQYNGGKIFDGVSTWTTPANTCAPSNGTATVGSYLPNAWGVYDMLGNVQETCLDRYTTSLGTDAVTDPEGPQTYTSRAARGGTWGSGASSSRAASRAGQDPTVGSWIRGFRLIWIQP